MAVANTKNAIIGYHGHNVAGLHEYSPENAKTHHVRPV